jgi:hypothetical protein
MPVRADFVDTGYSSTHNVRIVNGIRQFASRGIGASYHVDNRVSAQLACTILVLVDYVTTTG